MNSMSSRRIPAEKVAQIELLFPHHSTAYVAQQLGLAKHTVSNKAHELGLKKSPEYTAKFRQQSGELLTIRGINTRLPKGNIPYNKGKPMEEEKRAKCEKSFFKKGHQSANTKPIGFERIGKDGYIEIRTASGFKPKQRAIWEEHYGAVPAGHIIVFIDGNKMNFDIQNLELISRAENANRNRFSYSPEYKEVLGLLKQIDNKIKQIENEK